MNSSARNRNSPYDLYAVLKAAARDLVDPRLPEDSDHEWTAIRSQHPFRSGSFVAQMIGGSMEPAIPDGSIYLFGSPVAGTRQSRSDQLTRN